jgi:hypothetical protein
MRALFVTPWLQVFSNAAYAVRYIQKLFTEKPPVNTNFDEFSQRPRRECVVCVKEFSYRRKKCSFDGVQSILQKKCDNNQFLFFKT